jgi:hypothetical protein
MDAVITVELEVRELIRRSGMDPARDARGLDRLVRDVVATTTSARCMAGFRRFRASRTRRLGSLG